MTASDPPEGPSPPESGAFTACERLMQGGSKTFFAASLLLPWPVRRAAIALYAFCRVADDAIDLSRDRVAALGALRARLARIYDGRPDAHDADRALAPVVEHHRIPRELLEALLEGFEWDAAGRHYETLSDLYAYAARVAGTVGAMMAIIMRTDDEAALARACELGVAMQLTNIARDVGEDARNGRLYLPRRWMREEGLDPDTWLAAPAPGEALGRVIARLLEAADRLYDRAGQGIAALPRSCRPAIQAARRVYAEIGREVERADHDSVSRRAVVSRERKLALVVESLAAALRVPAADGPPLAPLPEIEYLVRAARLVERRRSMVLGSFYQRTLGVIDLIESLAERNRFPVARGRLAEPRLGTDAG